VRYDPFVMERWQSTYEHRVRFNLSESGVHPLSVTELLTLADVGADALDGRLGYGQSNGSDELRNLIASLYPGATDASVLVTAGGAEANFTVFWELMQPEALVAVMLPNYMQVPGLLESFGARIHPFHLAEEEGWQPDLNELETGLKAGALFNCDHQSEQPHGSRPRRRLRVRDRRTRRPIRSVDSGR
jgi:DNA-binding transcriptional MocR family regulator